MVTVAALQMEPKVGGRELDLIAQPVLVDHIHQLAVVRVVYHVCETFLATCSQSNTHIK